MKIFNFQAPFLGLNTVNPFSDANSGFARELTNYCLVSGRIQKRPAVRTYGASLTLNPVWFDPTTDIAIATNGTTYNVVTNATVGTIGVSVGNSAKGITTKHMSLDFVIGVGVPRNKVNPFTPWSFTTVLMTATNISCAVSHKGRLYVCDGTSIEYSPVAAIAGAMSANVNMSEFLDGQKIINLYSLTVQTGNQVENVLVFIADGGRVLIYQGDFPAAGNWYLIGKFDMPAPISRHGSIAIDGDVFIATNQYCYWVSALLQGNSQTAYFNSPSLPIENLWANQNWGRDADITFREHSHVFYIKAIDAIICQCKQQENNLYNKVADYQNEAVYFVYFRKYKAWAMWLQTPFYAPVVSLNDNYYSLSYGSLVQKITCGADYVENGSFDYDQTDPTTFKKIETSWKTPYFGPFDGIINKVNEIRPFYTDSLSGQLAKVRAIYDCSDLNNPYGFYSQSSVPAVNPLNFSDITISELANNSRQYSPIAQIAGQGGSVSFQFSQEGSDTGTNNRLQGIYACAVYCQGGNNFK